MRDSNPPPLPPFSSQRGALSSTSRCETCGQSYDVNDPDQVAHHGAHPHGPLDADSPLE
jgi:hypothetical protein